MSEKVNTLLDYPNCRIEKIMSQGHCSPEGFWYDQDENEWVTVLQGRAVLGFENGREIEMKPGDHLNIPAHQKHRIQWTDPEQETIWLAVFYP